MAERFDGELKFTTIAGEEKKSQFKFLNGKVVEEAVVTRSEQELTEIKERLKKAEKDDQADPPPVPSFSPREALVSLALASDERPLLARNLANRLWARFMGHGLVRSYDGQLIWWSLSDRRAVRSVNAHEKWIRCVMVQAS